MKLLLILGSDETFNLVSHYIKPLGFDLIRYNHVQKAMDNIDEVDPAGLIISANDFPRHWKILVHFVRVDRDKDRCPIVLLTGEKFPLEEASKAFFIGVSGIVPETLGEPSLVVKLQNILSRYMPVEEKRRAPRFLVEPWQRCALIFANPLNKVIVTGEVKTIARIGLSFHPDYPSLLENLYPGTLIPECSFRLDNTILSPECRLTRVGRIIALEFINILPGEQAVLDAYLENLPLQELRYHTPGLP
ncbi:PilZ domain-containing protein [Treponema sp. TIM-1]|uniref:PilZ domain-containing protein n=1 Tax=Treponema sp. TIM-1 TaxID=2898417 RepID=UPI00397FE893